VPNTLIQPFVWGISAAAVRFGAGFIEYCGVVVLVERRAVVAELVGQHHSRQVAVVELVADLRVVVGVREVDPQRRGSVWSGEVGVREEVEEVELRLVDQTHRNPLCGRDDRATSADAGAGPTSGARRARPTRADGRRRRRPRRKRTRRPSAADGDGSSSSARPTDQRRAAMRWSRAAWPRSPSGHSRLAAATSQR
jgi:hypothetical protein